MKQRFCWVLAESRKLYDILGSSRLKHDTVVKRSVILGTSTKCRNVIQGTMEEPECERDGIYCDFEIVCTDSVSATCRERSYMHTTCS